jgi:hypothetical protein
MTSEPPASRSRPKSPTVASRKKVTPENLARLGPERLAEILASVAAGRPELKRRLRMELAAEQGAEHLLPEIDKRLASLLASRSKISWRQRNAVIREIEGLRALIAERLTPLDGAAALDRTFAFLDTASVVHLRMRDREGLLAAVYRRAAADLGARLAAADVPTAAQRLAEAISRAPANWAEWMGGALPPTAAGLADATLRNLASGVTGSPAIVAVCRQLADASGDVDAYRATFTAEALRTSEVSAQVAARLLAAGRVQDAGAVLAAGRPQPPRRLAGRNAAAAGGQDAWEAVWIDYLERDGQADAAQEARWAAFERTLSVDHARAFISRLTGFADVEAEDRALAYAAAFPDVEAGLEFLMGWPALREAAELIASRADDASTPPEKAELWAGRLRTRYPQAAHILLRKAAAMAFRRREFAICDRLTAEADSIEL